MDTSIPIEIHQIVTAFMRFDVRNRRGDEIHDASTLPRPKQEIIDASLKYLELTDNPNIRESIRGSLLQISYYQDGVGHEPLRGCHFELFPVDLSSLGDREISAVKAGVAKQFNHLNADKFIDLLRRVQAEFKKLDEACEAIEKRYHENA